MNETLPGLLASHAVSHPDGVALREKEFGIWQEITWAHYLAPGARFLARARRNSGIASGGQARDHRRQPAGVDDRRARGPERRHPANRALPGLDRGRAGEDARGRRGARHRGRGPGAGRQGARGAGRAARVSNTSSTTIARGMYGYEAPGLMSFEEVEALGERLHGRSPQEFERRLAQVQPGDTALLCATSGTTSIPKLAMLSHENLIAMASQLRNVDAMEPGRRLRFVPAARLDRRADDRRWPARSWRGSRSTFPRRRRRRARTCARSARPS